MVLTKPPPKVTRYSGIEHRLMPIRQDVDVVRPSRGHREGEGVRIAGEEIQRPTLNFVALSEAEGPP
jgi:hypothetical protein